MGIRGYGNAKFQTVSFLATTLSRVIQLSTRAANGDVDGWTWETAWVTGQRGEIVNGNQ